MQKINILKRFGVTLVILAVLAFTGLVFTVSAFAGAIVIENSDGTKTIQMTDDNGVTY